MPEYPNPCCNDPDNLEVTPAAKDLTVKECKVCGCKHYEFTVDPGELGVTGAAL